MIVLVAAILIAATAVIIPAASAQAALIVYNVSNIGPTLYQTNADYSGGVLTAPTGTPNKPITYVAINFAFNNVDPLPAGITVTLCNTVRCKSGMAVSAGGGLITHDFDGDSANTSWQYTFRVVQGTTHVLVPSVAGGTNRVQAAHNNP